MPSGLPGCTNQRAPCWPSAAPAPLPLPPIPASPNPRWRGPDGGVPRLERGRSFAPCCCLSADSSGAMAREATLRPPAPRAPKPSCRTAVSSTNTALKGRIWCRAMGLCPSGPTRGVSWGRAGGRGLGSLLAFRPSPQCPAVPRVSSSSARPMRWGRIPQAAPTPGPRLAGPPRVLSLLTQLVHPLPNLPFLNLISTLFDSEVFSYFLYSNQLLGVTLQYTLMPRLKGALCLAIAIETSSSNLLLACFRELAMTRFVL